MITRNRHQAFITKKILAVFFMLLFFSINSFAAVVVLNTSLPTTTTGTLTAGSPLTLSNYAVGAGTGRLLLVGVSWQNRNSEAVTTVTYGTQTLTHVVTHFTGNSSRVEIWSLKEDLLAMVTSPANIAVTFDDDIDRGAGFGAVSFSGVDQSLPYDSITTADGNSAIFNLPAVPSATNELVFAIVSQESETSPLVPDASLNEHWNFIATNGNRESLGAAATKAGAASVDMQWTNPGNGNDWAMAGLSIKPPQPPTIITAHAACPDLNKVTVVFSNDINTGTTGGGGGNPGNYALSGGATVSSAVVSGNKVTLTTSALLPTTNYTLTVNNVQNTTGIPVATNSTVNFTSPDCTGLTGSCVTFKDTFSSSSYSNNDSDAGLSWLTNWTETNDGTTSPIAGNILINAGELFFDGGTTSSIQRSLNLNPATYDVAYLSFSHETIDTWDTGGNADFFRVFVSGTEVATYAAPTTGTVTRRINITNNISTNTALSFTADSTWQLEDARLDNVEVIACSGPPTISSSAAACPALNQITVTFSKDIEITSVPATFTLAGPGTPPTIIGQTANGNTVTLTTSASLATLSNYTLTVNGVKDLTGNTITANSTSNFTTSDCTELVAQYRFDEETWDLTAGQVIDQIGNFNGSRIGSAAPIYPGQVCNAAYIPANVILADANAIDTTIDPNTDLGVSKGSINFWYQSDNNWVGGGDRILLDASDDSSGTNNDKYFFLLITNNGTLRFGLEDTNDGDYAVETGVYTKTANDWVHIGITWDLPNDELKIYVDGALAATDNSNTNGALGDVKSIYLGDNRSTYVLLGTQNSAAGRIDEAYFYNIVIDGGRMTTDMGLSHTCTAVACSYRDDFTNSSYANSDGTIPWLTDWSENDGDSTPPINTTGNVLISGGSLNLNNNSPATATIPNIIRNFSLSGVTSASIYYTYKLTGAVDNADEVVVTMDDGFGGSLQVIELITGKGDGTYSSNVTIPAPLLGLSSIRLVISINGATHYTGGNETISFLYLAIYPDNICSINTLHHLQMSHDGAGLTCEPENIKIKACADPSCVLSYTSPVTITTSPVTAPTVWTPANPITIPANAEATVQLSHKTLTPPGVPQTLALDITSSTPAPTDSNIICKDLSGTTLPNCNIIFYDSGFVFDLPAQLACGTTASTIGIRAVRKDTETGSCVSMFNSNKTINFTIPTAPSDDIVINENALYTFNAGSNAHSVPLAFSGGAASFTLKRENNVGAFTLEASHTDAPSGLSLTGTTSVAFRPDEFFLEAKDNTDTTFLDSANAAGAANWKASENFHLKLRAQCKGSGGSGTGSIATNYSPSLAEMWVELLSPAAGQNNNFTLQTTNILSRATAPGTWENISTKFNNGAVTDGTNDYADAAFHEVGVVKLHVRDSAYPSGGIPEQTLTVGRFTPHHFDTSVTHGCSGTFTYSDQAFGATVFAKNNVGAGETTLNYRDNFAHIVTLSDSSPGIPALGTFTNDTVAVASFSSNAANDGSSFGVGTKSDITYTFSDKLTAPETLELKATDSIDTAVTSTGFLEDTAEIRSGRLRLENVFGPVSAPLSMQVVAEYYEGTSIDGSFNINTLDSCTKYYADDVEGTDLFDIDVDNIQVNDLDITSDGTLANNSDVVNAGIGAILFYGNGNNLTNGPGNNNEGKVNLLLVPNPPSDTASNPAWMKYAWGIDCATGVPATPPVAETLACGTASFGLYRGDDRIIYWREVF